MIATRLRFHPTANASAIATRKPLGRTITAASVARPAATSRRSSTKAKAHTLPAKMIADGYTIENMIDAGNSAIAHTASVDARSSKCRRAIR